MVQIEPVKRTTVTEQIMEQIASLITGGQLKPGEQLPNERDLAERFGVTRGRVREALRALSLVGLITIKAGEGSFVNKQEEPIPSDTIIWMFHNELHNIGEIYAARKLIETEVYTTAASHGELVRTALLDKLVEDLTKLDGKDPEHTLNGLDRLDLTIGEHCGNQVYAKLMQTVVYLRRESSKRLLAVPGAAANSLASRRHVLGAFRSDRPEKAVKQAMDEFYRKSKAFYDNIVSKAK